MPRRDAARRIASKGGGFADFEVKYAVAVERALDATLGARVSSSISTGDLEQVVDLYLHIGTEKTGTTSVQRFFRTNRKLLAKHAILFPSSPGRENHLGLTAAALRERKSGGDVRERVGLDSVEDVHQFRETLRNNLKAEVEAALYTKAIMSGEHCSSRLVDDDEIVWLRDFLKEFFSKIYIVVYLRRQDDFFLSTYSTTVKGGSTSLIALPTGANLSRRYDFWQLCSRWAEAFGRDQIICRKYEKAGLKNGSIVEDILAVMGIPADIPFEWPERLNESLDAESLEFLRLFNQYFSQFEKNGLRPNRGNLVPLLSQISNGPLATLSLDELAKFMAGFEESNRRVAEEYFGGAISGSDDPLFLPRADTRQRASDVPLSVERAVEICAWLWGQKQTQVDRFTERLKKHKGTQPEPGRYPRRNRKLRAGSKE